MTGQKQGQHFDKIIGAVWNVDGVFSTVRFLLQPSVALWAETRYATVISSLSIVHPLSRQHCTDKKNLMVTPTVALQCNNLAVIIYWVDSSWCWPFSVSQLKCKWTSLERIFKGDDHNACHQRLATCLPQGVMPTQPVKIVWQKSERKYCNLTRAS